MHAFRKLVKSTLIAVYVLILVGGVVRSTGSGMGCPDWPRCFGQWVPPTSVEQLPENYKETYAEYRHKKNERFAKYLKAFGFENTANKILNDDSIKEEADFNPVKTWIEYLNRVVGVVIGFLIFLVFVYSLRYRTTKRNLTIIAFLTFVLVGFQGWLGSFVVSTNLTPWTITVHMFVAMVIVALLIYLMYSTEVQTITKNVGIAVKILLVLCACAYLYRYFLELR
jgi:heme a synthase